MITIKRIHFRVYYKDAERLLNSYIGLSIRGKLLAQCDMSPLEKKRLGKINFGV
jgi:hypothetical protein